MGRPDRVVAAAPYFNEADVVAIRLRELVGVVDAHVFCEAAWTYAGSPKPFGCLEAVFDALPAGEKVAPSVTWEGNGWRRVEVSTSLGDVVVVELVEEPPASFQDVYQGFGDRERWRRENYQRFMLGEALPGWLEATDVVALSDVDEVPSRRLLEWYVRGDVSALVQPAIPLHVGALNWRWRVAVPVILRVFRADRVDRAGGLEGVRRSACAVLDPSAQWAQQAARGEFPGDLMSAFGWHLSYLGGADAIRYKVREAAHPELERDEFVGPGVVEARLADGLDLFGRGGWRDAEWVGADAVAWPGVVLDDPAAWARLMVASPGNPTRLW